MKMGNNTCWNKQILLSFGNFKKEKYAKIVWALDDSYSTCILTLCCDKLIQTEKQMVVYFVMVAHLI